MNANVSFRHMDSSPALRDYAVRKLERVVDKYVNGRVDASITMSVEKFRHIANFKVQIKNLTVKVDHSSEDMYSSIDLALDKIERRLRRHKDRLRSHKPSNSEYSRSFKMSVVVPGADEASEFEEDFAEDYDAYPETKAEAPVEEAAPEAPAEAAESDEETVGEFLTAQGQVSVSRKRDYEAKPLSLEEAVLQLGLMEDRQFLVYTDAGSQSICIVYKREDGNVGLIEA